MKTNKVTSMTAEEIQAATTALERVRQEMGFLLPLSPKERLAAGRLGPKAVQTVQMRLATAREHKDTLPPAFDLRKFERETRLFAALEACLATVKKLQADVRDTFLTQWSTHGRKVAVRCLCGNNPTTTNRQRSYTGCVQTGRTYDPSVVIWKPITMTGQKNFRNPYGDNSGVLGMSIRCVTPKSWFAESF